MRLLAIDTSTDYLSVAVMDGERTLARVHRKAPRSHSSLLMPAIDAALKKAKTPLKRLDGFCISIGPGSFTGLRIGVATVKGLAFALKKPVVAVPTMDAIAVNAKKHKGVLCAVLDARKGKVYGRLYRSDGESVKALSKNLLMPLAELLKKLEKYGSVSFLGDFAEHAAAMLPGTSIATAAWHPRPDVIGRLGLAYYRKKKFVSVEDLEPLYLYSRECDITGR